MVNPYRALGLLVLTNIVLSCSGPSASKKEIKHYKYSLWKEGKEVDLREENLKHLPTDVTLSPDLLKAVRIALDYRKKRQSHLLTPLEKDDANFYFKIGAGKARGLVELSLLPIAPSGWGIEWWDAKEDHRGSWYAVDLSQAKVINFSFCFDTRDRNCPPKNTPRK